MGDLQEYRRRRDAGRTPEPVPKKGPLPHGNDDVFVIQEHHARRLHWDVRLEHKGVLVSWAVPKGLPVDDDSVRLAVPTEDHPLEYASFSGEIPKGEYGGGLVKIWDRGRYDVKLWTPDKIEVTLHGTQVRGAYIFFRGNKNKNWMVRRISPPQRADWQPIPELSPMLAVADELPVDESGREWAYEFKWDGVRAVARIEGGHVTFHSRAGNELTSSFPELSRMGESLGSTSALLDGEIVSFKDARPNFGELQRRLHVGSSAQARRLAASAPVTYVVFDVLHVDGRSCLELSYAERRKMLASLPMESDRLRIPRYYLSDGAAIVQASRDQGLEGVMAKRLASKYRPGQRSRDWIKVSNLRTQEVVIVGWQEGHGRRSGRVGSLLLGAPTSEGLRYIGKVGTGFTEVALEQLTTQLRRLSRVTPAVATAVPRDVARVAHWVRPTLVGEVVFRGWTKDGILRHSAWRGLRIDKDPTQIARVDEG